MPDWARTPATDTLKLDPSLAVARADKLDIKQQVVAIRDGHLARCHRLDR